MMELDGPQLLAVVLVQIHSADSDLGQFRHTGILYFLSSEKSEHMQYQVNIFLSPFRFGTEEILLQDYPYLDSSLTALFFLTKVITTRAG